MKPSRRRFTRGCLAAFTAAAAHRALTGHTAESWNRHPRTRLTDSRDRSLDARRLEVGETYVFHYPYVTTPCFLVDLGEETVREVELAARDGSRYLWRGGVGPRRSIVAYSAICAHRMTHPSPQVSFITYRHDAVRFQTKDERPVTRASVIHCCSEQSVYDARAGARVLGGPAPEPLASIVLEYDPETGALDAVGTRGPVLFDRFFREFGFRLRLDYGIDAPDQPVGTTARVVPLSEYTRSPILC